MNQNNNEVRQVTPEEIAQAEGLPMPLTQEELQKTQVLNLKELENTIRFEKITSKKPAVIVAVLGILLLTFGATFQIASSLSSKKEQKVENRKVEPIEEVKETKLNCVKTTLNNPNGTDVTYNISYKFGNDKLKELTKSYTLTSISGNKTGEETLKKSLDLYQTLLKGIEGYQVDLTSDKTTKLVVTTRIDFDLIDLTKIPQDNQNNSITKVDYTKSSVKTEIKQDMLNQGFTCEEKE